VEKGKLYINSGASNSVVVMCTENNLPFTRTFTGVVVENSLLAEMGIYPRGHYSRNLNVDVYTELTDRAVVMFNDNNILNSVQNKIILEAENHPSPQTFIKGALTGLELLIGENQQDINPQEL
jgi:hypothetical protein